MQPILTLMIFLGCGLLMQAQELKPEINKNQDLIQIRKDLDYANALMKKGIFSDDYTGKDYFTGYA